MRSKVIIFDVDGTLVETEEVHRAAFNETFKKWNLSWYWDQQTYRELLKVSGGKQRLMHYLIYSTSRTPNFSQEEIIQLHKEKTELYAYFLSKNKLEPRDGVLDVIKGAKSRNIKLAIATATSLENVEMLIENIWDKTIDEIFAVVATGNEVLANKPSPEIYKLVIKKLRTDATHCIAIEDSLNGLLSSKGAGIKTIITPSFYTIHDDFSLADSVLPSLAYFQF